MQLQDEIGKCWAAVYCRGRFGEPEAVGGPQAARLILSVSDREVAYVDRSGDRHRTTPALFEAWRESQRASVVSDPEAYGAFLAQTAIARPGLTRRRGRGSMSRSIPAAKPLPEDGYLTLKQAAAHLGIESTTLYQYVYRGTLKAERYGKRLFIPPDVWSAFSREWRSSGKHDHVASGRR